MSIKTTGLLQAGDLKTDPTVAGFVKNEADGDWLFGQSGSSWTFIETKELLVAATSITFTGLDGASEWGYRLVWENPFDAGYPIVTDGRIFARRNGGAGSSTASVLEVTPISATPVVATYTSLGLVVCGVIVPPGANDGIEPFFHSGVWEYSHNNTNTDAGGDPAGIGKQSFGKEVRIYPDIPRAVGAWSGSREDSSSGNLTSLEIIALQTDLLRPGSKWSLYKVDLTP